MRTFPSIQLWMKEPRVKREAVYVVVIILLLVALFGVTFNNHQKWQENVALQKQLKSYEQSFRYPKGYTVFAVSSDCKTVLVFGGSFNASEFAGLDIKKMASIFPCEESHEGSVFIGVDGLAHYRDTAGNVWP